MRQRGLSCRDLVSLACPQYTQSTMLLSEDESGEKRCLHASMAVDPPIFALLAAAVPVLRALQVNKSNAKSVARPVEEQNSTIKVAVIGAGAGTVPSSLVARHKDVQVVAIDIDAGVSTKNFRVHARLGNFMACDWLSVKPPFCHRHLVCKLPREDKRA
jgi:hypothetical protein